MSEAPNLYEAMVEAQFRAWERFYQEAKDQVALPGPRNDDHWSSPFGLGSQRRR